MNRRTGLGVLLLAVVLAGCTSGCATTETTPAQQRALILDATAKQLSLAESMFEAAAAMFDGAYKAKLITWDTYKTWADFAPRFGAWYPATVQLWKVARATNDDVTSGQISSATARMYAELLSLYTLGQQLMTTPRQPVSQTVPQPPAPTTPALPPAPAPKPSSAVPAPKPSSNGGVPTPAPKPSTSADVVTPPTVRARPFEVLSPRLIPTVLDTSLSNIDWLYGHAGTK